MSIVSGAIRSAGPAPAAHSRHQQLPADRVELPDVGPLVRPQPGPDRRRRPGGVEQRPGSTGAQPRDVIDAVPAGEHRADHRQRLRAAAGAVPRQVQPLVDQPGQVDPLRQHRRRQQPGVRHQIALIEGRGDTAQVMRCSVGWPEPIAGPGPPQNRTCDFHRIRLKQAPMGVVLMVCAVSPAEHCAACRSNAPRPPPAASQRPALHPGPASIFPGLTLTRCRRRFTHVRPSSLPLTCRPRMERGPLRLLPRGFAPRRCQRRTPGWGRADEH
jgi:hypothetical protein